MEILRRYLKKISFIKQWIKWIRSLYIDACCMVGINQIQSPSFQLARSIRQGCPLAPFLYLFIADSLGYVLEQQGFEGLKLPDTKANVID